MGLHTVRYALLLYKLREKLGYKSQEQRVIKHTIRREIDPKYVRFYNSTPWKVLSAKRLQDDDYRCAWCGGIATEVDHIIEIKTDEGWDKRLDYDNTRSLCHDCHDKRHKRFKRRIKYKKRPKGL